MLRRAACSLFLIQRSHCVAWANNGVACAEVVASESLQRAGGAGAVCTSLLSAHQVHAPQRRTLSSSTIIPVDSGATASEEAAEQLASAADEVLAASSAAAAATITAASDGAWFGTRAMIDALIWTQASTDLSWCALAVHWCQQCVHKFVRA